MVWSIGQEWDASAPKGLDTHKWLKYVEIMRLQRHAKSGTEFSGSGCSVPPFMALVILGVEAVELGVRGPNVEQGLFWASLKDTTL